MLVVAEDAERYWGCKWILRDSGDAEGRLKVAGGWAICSLFHTHTHKHTHTHTHTKPCTAPTSQAQHPVSNRISKSFLFSSA